MDGGTGLYSSYSKKLEREGKKMKAHSQPGNKVI